MRVTIHRVDALLYSGQAAPLMLWREFAFQPSEETVSDRAQGFRLVRMASKPIAVDAPVGCQLLGQPPKWLKTHFNPWGVDAATVWHLATAGERGFRIEEGGGV